MKRGIFAFLFVAILALVVALSFSTVSAQEWVQDPLSCPQGTLSNYGSVTCESNKDEHLCGVIDSLGQCYNNSKLSPPSSDRNTTEGTSTSQSGLDGGYVIDCAVDGSSGSEPYCNNGGQYWCNSNSSECDPKNLVTKCIGGKFAYESGSSQCVDQCQSGYTSCSGPGSRTSTNLDGDGCETDYGTGTGADSPSSYDNSNGGQTAVYNNSQCDTSCPDGWLDDNNDITDGCEIKIGGDCTVGGVSGTYDSDGNCVPDKTDFTTGEKATYLTNDTQEAMLWFQNLDSDGWLINATNATGATFGVDNNSCLILPGSSEPVCNVDEFGGGNGSWNLSGSNLFPEDLSYNVSLGTNDSLGNRLQVEGDINSSGTIFANNFSSNSPLRLQTGGITRFFINDSSGNVGIGTQETPERLSVNGTSNFLNNTIMNISQINTENATINLTYYNDTLISYAESSAQSIRTLSDFVQGDYSGTSASRDANSGKLGIGYKNGSNTEIPGRLAFWRFDQYSGESPKDYESQSSSFNASELFLSDPLTTGTFSTSAYNFTESNGYINVSNHTYKSTENFTISGWLYKNQWVSDSESDFGEGSNPNHEAWFSFSDDADPATGLGYNKTSGELVYSRNGFNTNELSYNVSGKSGWIHYAVTYNKPKSVATLYINGKSVMGTSLLTSPDNDPGVSQIGKMINTSSNNWTGKIDEVMISDEALGDSQVEELLYFKEDSSSFQYNFTGSYNGTSTSNSETNNWTKINIRAKVPSNTGVNATFVALDSQGSQVDSEEFEVSGGSNDYPLQVSPSQDARLDFDGSSDDEGSTWRINDYTIYSNQSSGSDFLREKYVYESAAVEINNFLNVTGNVTSQTDFCIEDGQCLSSVSGGGGGFDGVQGSYLLNNSGTLDFNETYLNDTIDSRGGSDFWNSSSGNLYPDDLSDNVGIGTDSPNTKLEVDGDGNFTGNVTVQGDTEVSGDLNPDTNTSFGQGTEIEGGNKHCLDGSSCQHYVSYNGSATVIK